MTKKGRALCDTCVVFDQDGASPEEVQGGLLVASTNMGSAVLSHIYVSSVHAHVTSPFL